MISLPGYHLSTLLSESRNARTYRARRCSDDLPVILKVLNAGAPSHERLLRFQREYHLTRSLQLDGVAAAYGLETLPGTLAIVLEDFGGTSLDRLAMGAALPLAQWLALALRITASIGQLHRRHITHRDLNPSNIVWNRASGQLKLIDLGMATELAREVPQQRSPERLEGSLAYMSPEQTGRMNQVLDYRTDFYSLGVSFYQLITGTLPFASEDPLELVHAHLARIAPPVHLLRPEVPLPLSAIIAKLMAKNADERYQSTHGLQADLQACLDALDGAERPIAIGAHDVNCRLKLPDRLYGRDSASAALLAAFGRAREGHATLLLVSGQAGVGKTALVRSMQTSVTQAGAYFIEGKFDQFKRNLPYLALSQACRDWVHQVLGEDDAHLADWRRDLQAGLGQLGQLMVELIPEIKLVIGAQPPLPALPVGQLEDRLGMAFRQFVHAIATARHPLVIFLDDLQWADTASLSLMTAFLDGNNGHLLLIGAYRDHEVDATHPLSHVLAQRRRSGLHVQTLALCPLAEPEIGAQLGDALRVDPMVLRPLAQVCLAKTGGNPFFLAQFLETLETQGLLRPSACEPHWEWDLAAIAGADITDNVVDLLLARLHYLPEATQRVLQWAACIGATFDLKALARACRQGEKLTACHLRGAIDGGLVLQVGAHNNVNELTADGADHDACPSFRFLHDRVQQAAVLLNPPEQLAAMHWRIGRLWLRSLSPEQQQAKQFELLSHLNLGIGVQCERDEQLALAERNLQAARAAKASAAYGTALHCVRCGLAWCQPHDWRQHYELLLALALEGAEAAYLDGDFVAHEELLAQAMQHVRSALDRSRCDELHIQSRITRGHLSESIALGLAALRRLGIALPATPARLDLLGAALRTRAALFGRPVESLAKAPPMTSPEMLAASRLLVRLMSPAVHSGSGHVPLLVLKLVQLSARFGVAPATPFALVIYGGAILSGLAGEQGMGRRCGEQAAAMLAGRAPQAYDARTRFMLHLTIDPWHVTLRSTLPALAQDYLDCSNAGDREFAANAAACHCRYSALAGIELAQVDQLAASISAKLAQLHQHAFDGHRILWQAVRNLRAAPPQPALLSGPICDEQQLLAAAGDNTSLHFSLFLWKLVLASLHHDVPLALASSRRARAACGSAAGQYTMAVLLFHEALSCLAALASQPVRTHRALRRRAAANQRMLRTFACHAPHNFLNKWHLVEAEHARLHGKACQARSHYQQAIALARSHRFLQDEAFACELAGNHALVCGDIALAREHLLAAYAAYQCWGAQSKLRQLEANYPQWLGANHTPPASAAPLDMASLVKSLQVITGELSLDRLLAQLVTVAIENAGARKGMLLLRRSGDWRVEAEADLARGDDVLLPARSLAVPAGTHAGLAPTLLHYVANTRTSCVVHDAMADVRFAGDAYVQQQQPRSLLCVPILRGDELLGAIYLENDATASAFGQDRLALLEVLAGQAAISIDNARLYVEMEDRVQQRTAELSQAYGQLQDAQQHLALSEKMASLGTLTAGVAHEINNPVNFAHAGAQVLEQDIERFRRFLLELAGDNAEPEVVQALQQKVDGLLEQLGTVVEGTSRVRDLVKNLQAVSRHGDADKEMASVNEGLYATIQLVRGHFSGHTDIYCELQEHPRIACWPAQLNQVFMNLIVNACQAIVAQQARPGHSGKGRLTISNRRDGDAVLYDFTDTGGGIPPHVAARIFEPFFTTKPAGEGTGLGLSISYKIAKKHNGDIQVASIEGQGSTFTLRLPLRGEE